ncbi:MAG: hypothetical protein ACM3KR_02265 [Deltaproteobacteria bacterium]
MKKKNFIFLIVIIITVMFSGCPDQEQKQQQGDTQKSSNEGQSNEEQKKDSTKLKKIDGDVQKMLAMFSGIPEEKLQKEEGQGQQQESQGSDQQGGQSGQSEGNQSEQGSQTGSQQSQSSGQQQEAQTNNKQKEKSILVTQEPIKWEQALMDVQKIHMQWNDYMPQAAKDGVSKNNIDIFDNTLNQLTNLIIMKKKEEAVISANNLAFSLINFWVYYKVDFPIDVLKLKYHIRNIIFFSAVNKWDIVSQNYNLTKSLFQTLRATSEKEQQEKINKIDFSLLDLEKVIKMKDYPLIRLKGKLVLDNLSELEKKNEE